MPKKVQLGVQLKDEEFKALGIELCSMIRSAETARDALAPRWKKVTSYYNNEPFTEKWNWLKKYKLQHFTLTQPKLDQLCAILTTSLFSQDRVFLARQTIGKARVQPTEDLVQFFLDQGFEQTVDEMAPVAACTNHGAIYMPFEVRDFQYGKEPVGFGFYGIAPGDFVVYPTHARNLSEALLVGHKKFLTLGQLEYLQKSGKYRQVPITGTDATNEAGMGNENRENSTPALPSHTPVRVDIVEFEWTKPGGKPRRYYAVVAFDTQQVLRLDEFPYRRCRYIDLRIKPRQYGGFWSMTSVGQDLQGAQWQYNQLQNLLVAGQWVQAFPWGVTNGGKVDKSQEITPMSLVNVSGDTTFPQLSFNAGEIPYMIQQIERQADAITRITQESTGVAISKRQTKAEYEGRQQGAGQGLKKFLSTFGESLAEAAYSMQEQLSYHYEVWAGVYPEQAEALGDPAQLDAYLDWEPAGKTPDTSSDEIVSKLQLIEQTAERDLQEAMAMGFDPTFDIGKVRVQLANNLRVPNGQDLLFDKNNLSPAMQGTISAMIDQKAEEKAVQMAEQIISQSEQEDGQIAMELEGELHKEKLKGEEAEVKAATTLHKAKLQIEALKQKVETTKAIAKEKAEAAKVKSAKRKD